MNVRPSRIKIVLLNLFILSISVSLSVLAAEGISRFVLDPVDYLNPTLETDEFLNHRIHSYTGGHDEWGFRNPQRPESAEIVCIGDSWTYGVSALAREAWPADLGRLRKETVYNMGLGGYGPIQYLHLMRTRAVKLHPKTVIIGFYFGNDLLDVYNVARFNDRWSEYAQLGDAKIEGPAFIVPREPGRFLGGLRDWLSQNSVLYVVITQFPAFDFVRASETTRRMAGEAGSLISYHDDRHNVMFNLSPGARFLDMGDSRIETAMDVTQRVMMDMRRFSEEQGFRLIVVLLPTKERVYGDLLKRAGYFEKYFSLAQAIDQEDLARLKIMEYLSDSHIEALDILPELMTQVEIKDLFPLTDSHPNKDGYAVIAGVINNYLNAHH